ncbi:tetratricopeptide repeat protein [Aquimarina sp. 2201CG1-2-11]|uniref:tetratricopeptide repeat protein n=1 Tax=Aquimarina discodermiae TaxID=3231043 RepID=UPI0034626AD1
MRSVYNLFFLIFITISFNSFAQDAIQQQEKKQVDIVFQSLKLALETSQKEKALPHIVVQKHTQLGKFYQKVSMYNEAIRQYNNALAIIEQKDTLTVHLKNEIGKIYLSLKNNAKAKEYFNENITIAETSKYTKGKAITKGLLGTYYEKEGKYLEALKHQKESLELFSELNDKEGIATVNENIGSIYEDLEQYDIAYQYFKKSEDFFKKTNNTGLISVLNNLGDINRKTGNYKEAIDYTHRAYQLALKTKDKYEMKSAHKDLSKAYALTNDYKNAFDHLSKSEQINEVLVSTQNTQQLYALQTVYETQQKEAQISLLLEQKKTNRANQDLLLVGLVTLVFITSILFMYFKRKRKEKSKILAYKQRTLKAELEKKEIEEKNLQYEVHLKTSTLSRYSLHLSQKNKILSDLSLTLTNLAARKNIDIHSNIKKLAKEINFNLKQEREWDEFNNFFKEIHPEFIKKLSSLSEENLSPAELRLGMLLRLNLSSKEIASILRVTPDSVRVARYRLRKKLPIDQKEELVNFMIAL